MSARFIRSSNDKVGHTWFQGIVTTTRNDLMRTFGEPMRARASDTEQFWYIEFAGRVFASVHGRPHEGATPNTRVTWHVGGRGPACVALVKRAVLNARRRRAAEARRRRG